MPAISFQRRFLDALLSSHKQQTTRKQTTRIKVGDTSHIYIDQRNRITKKPLRRLTQSGLISRLNWANKERVYYPNHDYAHFLGKVIITEVYDVRPFEMSGEDIEAWALDDGFESFSPSIWHDQDAYTWFVSRYGDDWGMNWYTVIRWDGWTERYFEPEDP